jgi:subtilase family serine protease
MPLAILAVTAALGGARAAAPPSQAAASGSRPLVTLPASAAPRLPQGATRLGSVPAGTALTIDVTLRVRDQGALDRYLAGVSSPASPLFRHFLAPGQFGTLFGPTQAQVTAVEDALRQPASPRARSRPTGCPSR